MAKRREVPKVRGVYERDPGSGVWWIQYKQGSVRKREKVGRRSDAIALYQQRKSEMRAGAKLAPNLRTQGIRFSQLADEALTWSEEFHPKGLRALKGRICKLKDAFGEMPAADLTPQIIDRWLTEQSEWSPATKNRYRAAISLTYRQAMRNGKIQSNPARLVASRAEKNGRIRYLLPQEENALRKAMKNRYECHYPALDVALHTGMRLSEQFTLEWGSVDFDRREIRLDETKNGSGRTVPMNSACFAALNQLWKGLPRSPGKILHTATVRVFRSVRGEPLDNPRAWFEQALKDAKIKDFRWHDLRHTFCSRLAMAGVDIRTIAQLAGHKTLAMAMRYSHLSPSHNLNAVEKLTQRRQARQKHIK